MPITDVFSEYGQSPFNVSAESWVAAAGFSGETCAPPSGYPLVFESASACLRWLRDSVFTSDDGYEGDEDEDAAIVDLIDEHRDHSSAEDLIRRVLATKNYSGDFEVHWAGSIHDYLSKLGSVEEWRQTLGDPTIKCTRGRWSMSHESWKCLGTLLDENVEFTWDIADFSPRDE